MQFDRLKRRVHQAHWRRPAAPPWASRISPVKPIRGPSVDQLAINEFDDAAYNMAAITATVALYRALVRKGLMPREEARQILLDAAISRSIEAEALRQETGVSNTTMEINDQSVEILKFIAEHL